MTRSDWVADMRTGTLLAAAAVLGFAPAAFGQASGTPANPQERPGGSVVAADPESPAMRLYAEQQKRRIAVEKELKKLRHKYFGSMEVVEIRQTGIAKLREYTDPAIYPSLIEIFKSEGDDVRSALVDHFADRKTEAGDAALAWMAVYDRDAAMRKSATDRLLARRKQLGGVPDTVKMVIEGSLKKENDQVVSAAGQLAQGLNVLEAIPWLIAAQFGGGGGSSSTNNALSGVDRKGDLAWIVIGKQIAFVSDLTPVVSDSAVGFDPTISVITEGVVLRIQDAAVTTSRTEIHNVLIDMSTKDWGKSTGGLGWDPNAWKKWYAEEYRPFLVARAETAKSAEPAAVPVPPGGP